MERLRRALGDGKLNFLGLSYGAHLGSTYAELLPEAHPCDGARRDRSTTRSSTNTLFSDAASAYEDTFNRFAAWCAQTSSCPLHGRDVAALFDSLVARADQQPIPAPECADGSCRPTVTGGELRLNLFNLLLVKDGIPAIGIASWDEPRRRAPTSRAGRRERVLLPARRQSTQDDPFAGLAINCIDYPRTVTTYEDFAAKALLGRVLAPHTQGAERGMAGHSRLHPLAGPAPPPATTRSRCVTLRRSCWWPRRTTRRPPTCARTRCATTSPGSVLLTRDGDGHTSSWLSGGRTRDAIADYLITKQTPHPTPSTPTEPQDRAACTAFVSSRIWFEMSSSWRFCWSSSCTVFHCWLAITWRFASARSWLIITNVDRKIASSETIIVSSPNGYSRRQADPPANQMTWRYTNVIEPAKRVIASAIRFWTFSCALLRVLDERGVDWLRRERDKCPSQPRDSGLCRHGRSLLGR